MTDPAALPIVDLRSDTVSRPTPGMLAAMAAAEVGDDVFGDDPTVNRLQARLAELAGKEAGLYLPSGTQSNLCALMAHCGRGDEMLVGQKAHTYWYEAGGAAVLGSIQPQPVPQEPDGTLNLDKLASYVKANDAHFARTRLLCLENTWYGHLMPRDYPAKARAFADRHRLGLHLDGARIFNAVVAQNASLHDLVADFDTVSICLSKGLGAPVGSVLVGSRELIARAHRVRKMLGGGMRQAGLLAAAGLYALDHHVARLADDHANARALAEGLAAIPNLGIEPVETNMLFLTMPGTDRAALRAFMAERRITLLDTYPLRIATHLDVDRAGIQRTIAGFREFFEKHPIG